MNQEPDPRQNLARALAETHLEVQGAEHDYRALLQDGHEHMQSRYPASALKDQPHALDHWAWHQEAMQGAVEKGGLDPVPDLPYQPAQTDQPVPGGVSPMRRP
jgi:hypothetical protein